jgi:TonB-linked SusC/RagA family outer membrane protein
MIYKNFTKLCLMLSIVMMAQIMYGQAKSIRGIIKSSEDYQPLIGATVLIKGTTRGTNTDLDGRFSIEAEEGNVLLISYVGWQEREITIGKSNSLDILLKPTVNQLDEVTITSALGQQVKKRNLSHSAQEVNVEELVRTGSPNLFQNLGTRVAGLTVIPTSGVAGASISLQLRGPSSIDGNNQPLIVIDGLPIDNRTFTQGALTTDQPNRTADYANRGLDINPNDIESLVVLKGPEAAALYGIDASSGAILITTKKGAKGAGRVTYDNFFRFDEVYRLPKFSGEYGRGFNGINEINTLSYFGEKIPEGTQLFDNVDNFFRTGKMTTHNLTVEGGSDNLTYRLSGAFTGQDGVVPTNDYNRLSFRINTTARINNRLSATTSFNYFNTNTNSPLRGADGFLTSLLQWPSTDDASVFLNEDGTRRRIVPALTIEPENPFFNVAYNRNSSRTRRTLGNISLTHNTTDWLSFTGRLGADSYTTLGGQFTHPFSNAGATTGGRVETYNETSLLLNGNLLGTVKKNFSDLNVTFVAGGTFDDRNYEVTSTRGEKLFLPDFESVNNTDPTSQRSKLTITNQRLVSLLSTLELEYKKMLILNVTARNDWSSTLPKKNNSIFYPSVGLTYIFGDLDIFKDGLMSFGKVRAVYSQTGKDARPYRIASRLVPQTTTGGGFGYDFFGANPDLKPESTEGYEVGAELKFLQNRIGIDFSYYSNTRKDQIVSQRLSYGTGFIFGLLNGGSFNTKGAEISLLLRPVQRDNFNWDFITNFTQFRTRVVSLPADQPEYYNSDTWLYANARSSAFIGVEGLQELNSTVFLSGENRGAGSAMAIRGYDALRSKNGDVLISPSNGLPIVNARFLPIGDRTPDFVLGFVNSINYKNFGVNFAIDVRKGFDVFNGTELFLWRTGLSSKTIDRTKPYVFQGVLRDGNENSDNPTINTIQITPQTRSDFFTSGFSEAFFVEKDINLLRIQDLTFSYSLAPAALDKIKAFKNFSIFLTGSNLFLWTNYSGADPMVNGNSAATTGAGAGGFDFGTLPTPRSYSFGLRAQF